MRSIYPFNSYLMSNQILNIVIDAKGRKTLTKYNQKIILVRAVNTTGNYQLVAAAISPFGRKTTLQFNDDWMIYATNDSLQADTIIDFKDQLNANLGQAYNYEAAGFVTANNPTPASAIQITNDRSGFQGLVFGLGQQMDVGNGQGMTYRSIAVQQSLYKQHFNFVPNNLLWVFIGSNISDNMLLPTNTLFPAGSQGRFMGNMAPPVIGNYLEVEIGKTKFIHFDNALNVFAKGGLSN